MKKLTLLTSILLLLLGAQSCFFAFNDTLCKSGYGDIVTEEVDLDSFTEITNETVIDIEIEQGDSQKVVIEGHENMINELYLSVINNKLRIDLRNNCYNDFKLKVYITIPKLEELNLKSTGDAVIGSFKDINELKIDVSSTGDVVGDGVLDISDKLELDLSSTGNVELEVNTNEIIVDLTSTGDIDIWGSCTIQDILISGTAKYDAFDLDSEVCYIESSGTGDAKVYVTEKLDVKITSVGDVYYMGTPSIISVITGIGNLIDAN